MVKRTVGGKLQWRGPPGSLLRSCWEVLLMLFAVPLRSFPGMTSLLHWTLNTEYPAPFLKEKAFNVFLSANATALLSS